VTWSDSAISLAEILALQIAFIFFGFGIERLHPARSQGIRCIGLNIAYASALRVIYAVLHPLSVGLTTLMVNALGGGLIELPSSGVGLLVAVPCFVLTMDAGEYLFHRAQHRIPFLWSMHSLHHSDPAVNVSTAPRHFWGEILLKAATVYALIGLLFKTNAVVVAAYTGSDSTTMCCT
jgi:sterol desaturase/sphingolipid hydroxylase (fatty acid hydroxylase superfamily)